MKHFVMFSAALALVATPALADDVQQRTISSCATYTGFVAQQAADALDKADALAAQNKALSERLADVQKRTEDATNRTTDLQGQLNGEKAKAADLQKKLDEALKNTTAPAD